MEFRPRSVTAAVALVFALVPLAGCESRRAESQLEEAQKLGAAGETAEAAARLRTLLSEHPDTEAAARAQGLLKTYEGLLEAAYRNRIRDAVDTLRRTARAVEIFREARKTLPVSLDVLVPDYLERPPRDPWQRPLGYATAGDHYEVVILGADAARGGEGENQDLRVSDGRVVQAPPWIEQ
jgi:hypothetical protein